MGNLSSIVLSQKDERWIRSFVGSRFFIIWDWIIMQMKRIYLINVSRRLKLLVNVLDQYWGRARTRLGSLRTDNLFIIICSLAQDGSRSLWWLMELLADHHASTNPRIRFEFPRPFIFSSHPNQIVTVLIFADGYQGVLIVPFGS